MRDQPRLPDHIQSIPAALAFWAASTPDAPALRAAETPPLSYRELGAAIARVAHRLAVLGVRRQQRVGLVLPVGLDSCVMFLGAIASAVAAPFAPAGTSAELHRDLARLRPDLLITSGRPEALAREVAARLAIPVVTVAELIAPWSPEPDHDSEPPAPDPEQIAVILHTSGTTALPKRVPRTHGNLVAAARAARAAMHLTPDDVLLLTAAAHHNLGLADFLNTLLNGGSVVITLGFDPVPYSAWLREHRPTWTVLAPAELNLLLAQAAVSGQVCIAGPDSHLRFVLAEAQAMAPETRERAERLLSAPVLTGYGMTETGNITKSGSGESDRREGSCGRSRGMAIRIIAESGKEASPGGIGEVVVRGPTVFAGYLDDPAANAAAFLPGGWFRTGDQGFLDEDGFLFLTGRSSEMINRGGEKIGPEEVDRALAAHPTVADAAVFAVPDARLGEDIVAAVVFKPGAGATSRELREWLLARLSPYKVPRRIWVIESLLRTSTGKVRRGELADRFRADVTGAPIDL